MTIENKLAATSPAGPDMGSGKRRVGVLLLAHGAPERIEDIPEFLLHVRGGRRLPEAGVREISERYALIGGGSPLLRITKLQAAKLAERLNSNSGVREAAANPGPIPVVVGMRNWKPFIPDAIRELSDAQIEKVVALCLAPQNSSTSVGLYRKRLNESVLRVSPRIEIDFIESWHDHPDLIAAFADKVSQALDRARSKVGEAVPVIFTAHSVPQRTLHAGDPYRAQVEETARLVAEAVNVKDWRLAFQSQGMAEEAWVGPTVESEIDRLAAKGHRSILIAPIGFVSDHVEILYDVDIAFREHSAIRGVTVSRSESLNDSPLFIQALAGIVKAHI